MKLMIASWPSGPPSRFSALTAIFGKIGVENVNSDFATLIRTIVILAVIVDRGQRRLAALRSPTPTWLFLTVGLATGFPALLLSRAPAGAGFPGAPIDKMSWCAAFSLFWGRLLPQLDGILIARAVLVAV